MRRHLGTHQRVNFQIDFARLANQHENVPTPVNLDNFYLRALVDAADAVGEKSNYLIDGEGVLRAPGLERHVDNLISNLLDFGETARRETVDALREWYDQTVRRYEQRIRRALASGKKIHFSPRELEKESFAFVSSIADILDLTEPKLENYRRQLITRPNKREGAMLNSMEKFEVELTAIKSATPELWERPPGELSETDLKEQRSETNRLWKKHRRTEADRLTLVAQTLHSRELNERYKQVMSRFEQPPPADIDQANAEPELDQLPLGDEDP